MKTLARVVIFVAAVLSNPAYAASEIRLASFLKKGKKVKRSIACVLLLTSGSALAGEISLETPHTIALTPPVYVYRCSAGAVTTTAYKTAVTGFSHDGNYVLGQVAAYFTCGSSGRDSTVHTVWNCAQLQWDLSGNLVSVTVNVAHVNGQPVSSYCPTETLVFPSTTPPSTSVVGNEFTNAGGYVAETILVEACGALACYATYYNPTLVIS